MQTYTGQARLTSLDGTTIKQLVHVSLSDEDAPPRSSAPAAPFRGEFWVSEGDLLGPLRGHAHCLLHLDEGTTLQVFVPHFDRGGSRAQCLGEGANEPPWNA